MIFKLNQLTKSKEPQIQQREPIPNGFLPEKPSETLPSSSVPQAIAVPTTGHSGTQYCAVDMRSHRSIQLSAARAQH